MSPQWDKRVAETDWDRVRRDLDSYGCVRGRVQHPKPVT